MLELHYPMIQFLIKIDILALREAGVIEKAEFSRSPRQACQLSRIIRETPDFESFLPVSRLESEISRIIAMVCNFL